MIIGRALMAMLPSRYSPTSGARTSRPSAGRMRLNTSVLTGCRACVPTDNRPGRCPRSTRPLPGSWMRPAPGQQRAQRLDHRRERLVLGEPAQAGRHRLGRGRSRCRGTAAASAASAGCSPPRRSWRPGRARPTARSARSDQRQHADRARASRARRPVGPEPDRAARPRVTIAQPSSVCTTRRDVPGEHRDAGDGHRAEPGDDALGHVRGDRDRRRPAPPTTTAIRGCRA